MATVLITAPTTLSGNSNTNVYTIAAPTSTTNLSDYMNNTSLQGVAFSIQISGTANGRNLTSMGKYTTGAFGSITNTVWRVWNGTDQGSLNFNLYRYGSGFNATYDNILGSYKTFIVSNGNSTHILKYGSTSIVKGAGNQSFNYNGSTDAYGAFGNSDNYRITGAGGADSLTGADGADTLIGLGGNDTLTGGAGADQFVFTNQGTDTISNFIVSDNDVFAITSTAYTGAPSNTTTPIVGSVATLNADPTNNNKPEYIIYDTLASIQGVTSSNTRFAYDTTNNQLLYDTNGNWSAIDGGTSIIANVTLSGTLTASNFDFV